MTRSVVIPTDTEASAHREQIAIYSRLGGRERSAIAFRWSDMVRRLTMAGIRRRHPHYSDDDVRAAYARLCLGDALVQAVWPDRALVEP